MSSEDTDGRSYLVVINDEEQYSIWLADRDVPAGWRAEGTTGTREGCLAHIGEVWTDMRPKSLRERMAAAGSTAG
jgi:MbtH protein